MIFTEFICFYLIQLYKLRVWIRELRAQIQELQVKIYEFKNNLINENSIKQL